MKDGNAYPGSFGSAVEADQYRRNGEATATLAVHSHILKLCKELHYGDIEASFTSYVSHVY
jgi:hypothetical protein